MGAPLPRISTSAFQVGSRFKWKEKEEPFPTVSSD